MKRFGLILAAVLMLSLCFVACDQGKGGEYTFAYHGTAVRIGDDGVAVAAALGQPLDYQESGSCGAEKNDKEYYYAGFRFDTVWQDGVDRIVRITLTDDSVATPEGVRIGDSQSAVVAAYGDGYTQAANGLAYNDGNCELLFGIRDGVVVSVQYRALSN